MTDQPNPGSANADQGASPPTPPPPPPPLAPLVDQQAGVIPPPGEAPPSGWPPAETQPDTAVPPPPVPPAKPQSKLRTYIVFGAIAVIIGLVLYAVRNNAFADDLQIGQCFDVPSRTEDISTVEKHECTEEHDAEVFHVAEMTADSYPITLAFDNFVDAQCIPAFATYVGRTFDEAEELNVGFFYPNADGWSDGDRTVTCYIVRVDEAKMTQSVKVAS